MPLFPTNLNNITLSKWIDYTNSLRPLNDSLAIIQELPECTRKPILLTRNMVDRAYHTYEYFGGTDTPLVDDILKEYNDGFCMLFDNMELPALVLPSPELTETNPITFGQFIDAKMITSDANRNRWELLQYVGAIFYLPKVISDGDITTFPYREEYCDESSAQFQSIGNLTMPSIMAISQFWEQLNEYANANFTLFQDSGEQEGANMKEHMQRWGWVNFLKSIAKTKVFDIAGSGLNSIDCARQAKCATVLTWASEEKDYNIALSRDMEDSYKNQTTT
jgi:hypothetical protein